MKAPLLLLISILLICCNPSSKQPGSADSLAAGKDEMPLTRASCYMKVMGKDTFELQIVINDEKVSGVLGYRFHEKDSNEGLISGELHDNVLRANYHFKSEGVNSTRPVVFKLMGDQVYEALPNGADSSGQPAFNDDDAKLKYDVTPYKKIPCE